jgi:hypothetical protein
MALRILRSGREHADMGGAICSVAAGHGRNWGTGAVTGCYGALLLGCREARGEVVPAVRLRDAAGTARVPEDILPLVRPKVDTQSGELWLFNGGVDQVELTWRNGAGEETRESVPAGAIVRRELN